eukprot:354857-Chlamydomonas_euryale.AAC.14
MQLVPPGGGSRPQRRSWVVRISKPSQERPSRRSECRRWLTPCHDCGPRRRARVAPASLLAERVRGCFD